MGGSLRKGAGLTVNGGGQGQYMFTDLAELDGFITEWTALRDRIESRGTRLIQAAGLITPPAEDIASRGCAKATRESLLKAIEHCDKMRAYADGYAKELTATRAQYAETEAQTVTNIQQSGES